MSRYDIPLSSPISDGANANGNMPLGKRNDPVTQGDAALLDAYSQAVISVVDTVSPAVVSLTSGSKQRPTGSGSGFLISPDGYAMTNCHVVQGQARMTASTADGDQVDASIVGTDPATDLALVRLSARDLPYAQLGDSETLRVGQLVIAMGSPLGLQATVSTGIVSALGRSMRGQDGRLIESVIQHTAPINPGNSGGPLVDSRGRVAGVNTAIIAMAQGLGFAVPSKTAQWVASEFLSHGRVRRRQLGIVAATQPLSRAFARAHDLLADHAVEVIEVASGSEAERAGVLAGDLLVAISDRIVSNVDDVHRLLTIFPQDADLVLSIIRRDQRRELTLRAT